LLGTLCFLVGLAAAAAVAVRMRRRLDPLQGGLVAACLATCAYWLLQGAVDVLLEIPALGAIALGLLGLASSSRAGEEGAPERAASQPGPRTWKLAAVGGAAVVLVSLSVMLALPWLSTMYVSSATHAWRTDPKLAYGRLERAASLAPLSSDPFEVEGSIALRRRDLARSRRAFERALARNPSSWYAHLELGLLEGSVGAYAAARKELAASLRLNPNERVTRLAWRLVRRRARIDPEVLNRTFVDPSFRPPGLESYTHDVQTQP
jgi:tetratricopeptide (TPR) repeat protein